MNTDELKKQIDDILNDESASDAEEILDSVMLQVAAENEADRQYLSDLDEMIEILKKMKDAELSLNDKIKLQQIRSKLSE